MTREHRTDSCFVRNFAAATVADDDDDGDDDDKDDNNDNDDNDGDNQECGEPKADLPKKQFGG